MATRASRFLLCALTGRSSGYEISPHPDICQKALTYMVNVNPSEASETADHHTHYLKFRPEYKYVQAYWEGNLDVNRCWVPWEWCESVKTQTANNSIFIFAPSEWQWRVI